MDQNFRSFFAILKKKKIGQYDDNIQSPKYKKKGDCFNIIFTNQNSRIKRDKLTFHRGKEYKA